MKHGLNRVFRLIWNESIEAWVAVAEHTRGRGKRASRPAAIVIAGVFGLAGAPALAGPTGGQVLSGSASITTPSAGSTVINQTTNQAIINWAGFNIGATESVRFNQPGSNAATLNRVLDTNPTSILGKLDANGRVFVVNPNGVIFGANSQVNVGALVATSLQISDTDFNAGRLRFIQSGAANDVLNQGLLTTSNGGFVALIGKRVRNEGSITTPGGFTALAAGSNVTVDTTPGAAKPVTVGGEISGAAIESVGAIRAQDGQIILSARAADAGLRNIINHSGIIEARGMTTRGGRIVLEGGFNGAVSVSGKLDASSAQNAGGQVSVSGNAVAISSGANIDVRGATGGGSALVGGNYTEADNAIRTARVVDVEAGAQINASATQNGDGGSVTLTSLRNTRFTGAALATGGSNGGNGGSVRVASNGAGYGVSDFGGSVDVSAPKGTAGNITVSARAVEVHAGNRKADTRSFEDLINSTATGGVSNVSTASIESISAGNLTIEGDGYVVVRDLTENGAKGSIDLQRDVSLELYGKALTGAPTLPGKPPAGGIDFQNANNTLNAKGSGTITLTAGAPPVGSFNPLAGMYNVGNINTEGGAITLNGADKVVIEGALQSRGGKIDIDADADRLGAGKLIMRGRLNSAGGDIRTNSGADANSGVDFLGTVDTGAGRLILDVSPSPTPNDPASYLNRYRVEGSIKASGDIQFGQRTAIGGTSTIDTTGKVGFGSIVEFDPAAALTLTAGQGGVVFSDTVSGNGGSLTIRPNDPAADIRLGASGSGMDLSTVLPKSTGFKEITIGRSDGTGRTLVSGTAQVDGALKLLQGAAGGKVEFVDGTQLTDRGAGEASLLVQAGQDVNFGAGSKIDLGKGITAEAGNLVTLGSGSLLKTTQPDSKVVISATTFVNPNGASGLQTPRWLVYLPDPTQAPAANLTADFKRYGCTYQVGCLTATMPGSGNGFLYRIVPVIKVSSDNTTRVYGDADPTSFNTTYSGFIDGDTDATSGISGQGAHTLAGFTPTASGRRGVGDYDITHGVGTLASELGYGFEAGATSKHSVTPKVISAPALITQTREYDGTTNANSSAGPLDIFAGDRVDIQVSGAQFADKNAGVNKPVSASGALNGAEAGNYQLATSTLTGPGTITPKLIDGPNDPNAATFNDRVYDGTRNATGQLNSTTLTGVLAGDTVTVDLKQASFGDKNVGNNKAVTGELQLSGASAGNYALKTTTVLGQASITPRIVATPAVSFFDKPYDGNTLANGVVRPFGPGAVIGGDDLGAALSNANFNDPTSAVGKPVSADLTLTGIDAGNYRFTNRLGAIGVTGTATIFPLDYEAGKTSVYASNTNELPREQTLGDAASRLIAGGMKLPPGVESTPVTRVEK